MQEPLIFGVPLDHCMKHGFWFDAHELAETLAASKNDLWRLYGSAWSEPRDANSWNPLGGLIEIIRAWFRK